MNTEHTTVAALYTSVVRTELQKRSLASSEV